jgi:hypothetical protein
MARTKIDGVIEAVRYNPDGSIKVVRGYERRGVVWTDEIMLNREDLIDRLKLGKRFVTGVRKTYLGSVFDTGKPVQFSNEHIITEGQADGRDMLAGVGIF